MCCGGRYLCHAPEGLTCSLALAIFSSVLGMIQFGYNIGVINAPQKVCHLERRESCECVISVLSSHSHLSASSRSMLSLTRSQSQDLGLDSRPSAKLSPVESIHDSEMLTSLSRDMSVCLREIPPGFPLGKRFHSL